MVKAVKVTKKFVLNVNVFVTKTTALAVVRVVIVFWVGK